MRVLNILLILALVGNLWYEFNSLLIILFILDIILHMVVIVAIKKRNASFRVQAWQLWKFNTTMQKYNEVTEEQIKHEASAAKKRT